MVNVNKVRASCLANNEAATNLETWAVLHENISPEKAFTGSTTLIHKAVQSLSTGWQNDTTNS